MKLRGKLWSADIALSLLAAILAITVFFNNRIVDIHLHDTYFVLPAGYLQVPFAHFFGIEAWLYHLVKNRRQTRWMKAVHVLSCWLFVLFIFWIPVHISPSLSGMPRRYYDYSPGLFKTIKEAGTVGLLLLMFALGQLLFLVHIVISLLKKKVQDRVDFTNEMAM